MDPEALDTDSLDADALPHSGPRPSGRARIIAVRALGLVAGLLVGLVVFTPRSIRTDSSLELRFALEGPLVGISLAGVWLAWPTRKRRLGTFAWLWLATGLGVLLMLPPAVMGRFFPPPPPGGRLNFNVSELAQPCLWLCLPFVVLAFVLATLLLGRYWPRKLVRRGPFAEQAGWIVAQLWAVFGLWALIELYVQAFWQLNSNSES